MSTKTLHSAGVPKMHGVKNQPKSHIYSVNTTEKLTEDLENNVNKYLDIFFSGKVPFDTFVSSYLEIYAVYYAELYKIEHDGEKEKLTELKLVTELMAILPAFMTRYIPIYLEFRMGTALTASKLRSVRELYKAKTESVDFTEKPELINTWGGVINASTKEVREHQESDNFKHKVDYYSPKAKAPTFERILKELNTDYNPQLGEDLIKTYAYCAFGGGSQKTLVILWGNGDDGKSLIQNAVREALGDYGYPIEPKNFKYSRNNTQQFRTWMVAMSGRKTGFVSEWGRSDQLDNSLIKSVASGGRGTVAVEMKNQNVDAMVDLNFSIILDTNFLPTLMTAEPALLRRLAIFKFTRSYSKDEQDSSLKDKLTDERAGILNMLIDAYDPNWKIPKRYYDETLDALESEETDNDDNIEYIMRRVGVVVDLEAKHHIKMTEVTQNQFARQIMRDNHIKAEEIHKYFERLGVRIDKSFKGGKEYVGLAYDDEITNHELYEEVKRARDKTAKKINKRLETFQPIK